MIRCVHKGKVLLSLAVVMGSSISFAASGDSGTNDAQKQVHSVKRDPFWPVDYKPKGSVETVSEADMQQNLEEEKSWNDAMRKVVINGVSKSANNEQVAIINGSVYSVGETVSVSHAGSTFTWAVGAIEASGSVKLRRVSIK